MAQPVREVIEAMLMDQEDSPPPETKAVAKRKSGKVAHLTSFRMPTRAPEVDATLQTAIEDMADEFIECRDYGHKWRPLNASWSRRDSCYCVELLCASCSTTRTRFIGAHGQLLENRYGYTPGYQMPSGRGRMTNNDRDALRFASLRRLMAKPSVANQLEA